MEKKEIHLNISLQEEKILVAYDAEDKVEVCGQTVADVKRKAIEAVQALYGKDYQVSFSYIYVEEEYQALFEKAIGLMLEKHRGQRIRRGSPIMDTLSVWRRMSSQVNARSWRCYTTSWRIRMLRQNFCCNKDSPQRS